MANLKTGNFEFLIVNSDQSARFFQHRSLVHLNLKIPIFRFDNARKALAHISREPGMKYLIFLNLHMPLMDGWEFLKQLNSTTSSDRFLVAALSSYPNQAEKERALEFPQVLGYYKSSLTSGEIRMLLEEEKVQATLQS